MNDTGIPMKTAITEMFGTDQVERRRGRHLRASGLTARCISAVASDGSSGQQMSKDFGN